VTLPGIHTVAALSVGPPLGLVVDLRSSDTGLPPPHCDGLTLLDADAFFVPPATGSLFALKSNVKKPVGAV
jgi:hypothetical protein